MRPTPDDEAKALEPLLAPAWRAFISPSRAKVLDFALAAKRLRSSRMAITQVAVQTDGVWMPIKFDEVFANLNSRLVYAFEHTSSQIDSEIDESKPPKPRSPTRVVFTDEEIRRIDLLS